MRSKLRKVSAGIVAGVLVAGMVLTGTLAWQAISQEALNEKEGFSNPGGRLHDDFNGENKDIYVENFSDPENGGVDIFARIRLYEYMEVGPGAGLKRGEDGHGEKQAVSLVGGADIDDLDSWTPHIPNQYVEECTTGDTLRIHDYWTWQMGGSTVYMPTFNMNKDSLEADINGSFTNLTDYNGDGVADPYEDYKSYDVGDTELGFEILDIDDNDADELKTGGIDIQKVIEMDTAVTATVESAPYTDSVELNKGTDGNGVTHTARETLDATVLTMDQWLAQDAPKGPYWVIDTDGWAYWADAIEPGTATGLLLSGILPNEIPDSSYYYGIHVVAQFSTVGDWGKADGDTFYSDPDEKPSDNAVFLLNQAAGRLPSVRELSIAEGEYITVGDCIYVHANADVSLIAEVAMRYPSGDPAETAVFWDISPITSNFSNGNFYPTVDMIGKTYTVTATSSFDPSYTDSTEILIIPADVQGVVIGQDGSRYLDYGDNTYRKILDAEANADQVEFGPLVSAGPDETIGNRDDIYNVIELETPDPQYGGKFIGPFADDCYWAMGTDNMLGNSKDIIVTGDPWPDNIVVPTVTIHGETAMDVGYTLQLTATTTPRPCDISWSLEGSYVNGTKIDDNGLLTVALTETATSITVKARAEGLGGVEDLHTVTLYKPEPEITTGVSPAARGLTKQFSVNVTGGIQTNYTVKWTLSGSNPGTSTAIDPNTGVLTVDFSEPVGTELSVTATLENGTAVTMTPVTVTDWATIDGYDWWVVVKHKDSGELLLLSKYGIPTCGEDSAYHSWGTSVSIRPYVHNFLVARKKLNAAVTKTTEIYTRTDVRYISTITKTDDRIFLLSEADYYGTINGGTPEPEEYTYNETVLPLTTAMRTENSGKTHDGLRSPSTVTYPTYATGHWGMRSFITDEMVYKASDVSSATLRPALWAPGSVVVD